jgi:hypothetical protein
VPHDVCRPYVHPTVQGVHSDAVDGIWNDVSYLHFWRNYNAISDIFYEHLEVRLKMTRKAIQAGYTKAQVCSMAKATLAAWT